MDIKRIKTEQQYREYLKRLEDIFFAEDGTPEGEELDVLADVLELYEQENYPIVNLDKSTYQSYVDRTYKHFLKNKKGGVKLDVMLDIIDEYDNTPAVDYYRIDDDVFEEYRFHRKLIRGMKSGFSNRSIEDIIKGGKERLLIERIQILKTRGIEVFGSENDFIDWLDSPNVFLEDKKPLEFLNTTSGIKLINSRLTGIQYGDNI